MCENNYSIGNKRGENEILGKGLPYLFLFIYNFILQVIYFSDKHASKPETVASKRMLAMSRVSYRQFIPTHTKITIDFDSINLGLERPGKEEGKSKDKDTPVESINEV